MKNKNKVKAWAVMQPYGMEIWQTKPKELESEQCEIVFNGGWIHVSDRRPTKKDADRDGCVLVWYCTDNSWNVCDYQNLPKMNCYWQSPPKGPKKGSK